MNTFEIYFGKGCPKCGSHKLEGGLSWIEGLDPPMLCCKCSKEKKILEQLEEGRKQISEGNCYTTEELKKELKKYIDKRTKNDVR